MQLQSLVLAIAVLAGVGNAAALKENTSGASVTDDSSNTPDTVMYEPENSDVAFKFLPNFEVTTYSGNRCNGTNQGTTRVDQSTRACIQSSNAKSYHLTPLQNIAQTYPTCKKVQVQLKNSFHCHDKKTYFQDVQKTGDCYHFYGPASHKSFWVKCVAV